MHTDSANIPVNSDIDRASDEKLTRGGEAGTGSPALVRTSFWILAVGLAALLALTCSSRSPRLPIVLIVIDTLRWDRLSLAGYERPTSPRLDAFAADATTFSRTYAPASWTRPSVASLITGLDPRHHGAVFWNQGIGPVATLAEHLQRAGYATRGVNTNVFLKKAGFERGFDRYETPAKGWNIPGTLVNETVKKGGPVEPGSFLYVHYLDPHDPYDPDAEARALLVRPYQGDASGSMEFIRGPLMGGAAPPNEDDVRHLSDLYDAEVRTVDAALGDLLDWLRETGVYDDALVIVTSDHGEELYEHGSWLHGFTLFDEQLHVPLLIKPPQSMEAGGAMRDEPVSLVDVAPTILELAGLDAPSHLDGRSLVPLLRGEPQAPPQTLYALEPLSSRKGRTGVAWSARNYPLKWIRVHGTYPSGRAPWPGECFDLLADPGEQQNLARLGPGPCAELASAAERWRAEGLRDGTPLEVEPSTEQQLRALGYLH